MQDSEGTDLYAYTGPDEAHLLAPNAFAIAISPDGSKVLAAVGVRTLEVIHIASGAVEDALSLDAPAEPGSPPVPAALMYGGSWVGDRIVANSDRGLVVLNVRGGLHIESLFKTPSFPHGVSEPVLVGETHVRGWADLAHPQQTTGNVDEPRVRQRTRRLRPGDQLVRGEPTQLGAEMDALDHDPEPLDRRRTQ